MGVYTDLTSHWNMDSIAITDPVCGNVCFSELDSRVREKLRHGYSHKESPLDKWSVFKPQNLLSREPHSYLGAGGGHSSIE